MPKRIEINEANKAVTVRLRNVRLSFPSLFEQTSYTDDDKPAYQATFIFPKEGDAEQNAKYMQKGISEVLRMNNDGGKLPADRLCLKCGSQKSHLDGYGEDVWFVPSRNTNPKPILVIDRDRTPLRPQDGKPYAGCYVYATVELWWQANKFGKRVNAQLRAVAFWKDGEPFGQKAADIDEEFDDLEAAEAFEEDGDEADWL